MITTVTNSTQAALAASTATSAPPPSGQSSDVTTEDTPFGQLLVENMNSTPTIVGYIAPNSTTVASGYADSPAASSSASTAAAATPAATTMAAATTTPAATSASATTTSAVTTTPAASTAGTATTTAMAAAATTPADTQSTTTSSSPVIPGVSDDNPNDEVTAQSVFGNSPWESDAGGTGPAGTFSLNPTYFATEQTAQMVANMVGGTVVDVNTFANTPGNPFSQNEPNLMIQLSGGAMINAGLVAGFFSHGYQLSEVQQMIQNEVTNVEAEAQGADMQGVTTT